MRGYRDEGPGSQGAHSLVSAELLSACHMPGPLTGLWGGAYMNVKQASSLAFKLTSIR